MTQSFHIRLAKAEHVFSAAHFITYGDDNCERLHGHNYRVAVELYGPLDENHLVFDFVALRDAVSEICGELDHRMLLATGHPTIKVEEHGGEVTVRHANRRWVFPRGDCALLALANTTAELLAAHVAAQLLSMLPAKPERLVVSVDECDGQCGVCDITAD